jgi:hypothetical protein
VTKNATKATIVKTTRLLTTATAAVSANRQTNFSMNAVIQTQPFLNTIKFVSNHIFAVDRSPFDSVNSRVPSKRKGTYFQFHLCDDGN